ncbi:MAG: hypothetical protein JXM70_21175 [Pirellulales bacterium]|nr:hypothetical protein [Pirellulales bacterium]
MLKDHVIFGIHITNRVEHSPSVQHVLTDFGCNIKTRIGLHDVNEDYCSPNGLLLIEFVGSEEDRQRLKDKLVEIKGTEVQIMVFDHP